MVHSTHLRSFCALFTSGFTTVVNWLLISWDANPFLRDVAVFFWSHPIWHMEKIWGCGGLKILNKRTQLESEVLFLLLERCQQIFDEDVEFWDVQHAKQQLETWGKTSWNQDEVTYVPIHPPLTADLQGPCLGRRSALGKRASECQQPGKSYEWLVDGGGQRAFHSLHPAGEKTESSILCVEHMNHHPPK